MVLQADAQVLSKGNEAKWHKIVRDVPSRNLQERLADLLLPLQLR
jgi:hypothetical protein